ncbi:hypothetical protein E3A20_25280, partial [Planctomyces bekefii]
MDSLDVHLILAKFVVCAVMLAIVARP